MRKLDIVDGIGCETGSKRDELVQAGRAKEIEQLNKEVRALQGRLQETESR